MRSEKDEDEDIWVFGVVVFVVEKGRLGRVGVSLERRVVFGYV